MAGELLMSSGCTTYLLPQERNVHGLTSRKETVLLDLLLNHYDDERQCSYYSVTQRIDHKHVALRLSKQE